MARCSSPWRRIPPSGGCREEAPAADGAQSPGGPVRALVLLRSFGFFLRTAFEREHQHERINVGARATAPMTSFCVTA